MTLQLSWDLSRSAIESADSLQLILMVRLRAAADPTLKRAPLNLGVALDCSGSMYGAKLEQCKFAAGFLVKHLTADDMLSVVAFDSKVSVVAPHAPVTNPDRVLASVASLQASANTNLSGGWLEAARMVEATRQEGRINRVLLLTDGEANAGLIEPSSLLNIAQELQQRQLHTTTIGFGESFNEDLLKGIADAGGGNFHYIENTEETTSIFARELQELLKISAQNVRLRIVPAGEVTSVRLLQLFPITTHDGGIEVSLGDLLAGEEKRLLIELTVPRTMLGKRGMTELHLTYQQVAGDLAFRELYALVETPERGVAETTVNPVVWREVVLNDAATAMREAREKADAGQLDDARGTLDKARQALETSPHANEPEYQERRTEINRIAKMLENQASYHGHGRKAMMYASHGHGHQSSHSKGGAISPLVRKAFAVAKRLLFITGPGLALESGKLGPVIDGEVARRPWPWILKQQEAVRQCGVQPGHTTIRQLELAGRYESIDIVTSATEGLHNIAGSNPIELYGSIWTGRCEADGTVLHVWDPNASAPWITGPNVATWLDNEPRCTCGRALVPTLIEMNATIGSAVWDQARAALAGANAVVVAGTAARTKPMHDLVKAAVDDGIPLVWIHPRRDSVPSWTPHHVDAGANDGLRQVVDEIMWY
jgi:Ca-activated chloride channel family protein